MTRFFTPRRNDFSDTLVLAWPHSFVTPSNAGGAAGAAPTIDPLEQLLAAERADWSMLRLVMCSAVATLVLGLAGSLVG